MVSTKKQPRRKTLNDRIEAAFIEDVDVAGITTPTPPQFNPSMDVKPDTSDGIPAQDDTKQTPIIVTKKATTIMPKEVFNALQMYCMQTDTPKHRALYLFIVEGLHNANQISDEDYQRFRNMASLLTTTYAK